MIVKENDLVPKKEKDGTWTGLHWSGTSPGIVTNMLKMMRDHGCSHLVFG